MISRLVTLLAIPAATLHAQLIGGGAGTSSNFMPLGGISNVGTPVANRYQQLLAASSWSGTTLIGGIRFFRASAVGDYRTATLRFSLSTSSRNVTGTVNRLNELDFNSNVGIDRTVLGELALSGAAPPTVTVFGGPFSFNPAAGNLLLDIEVLSGGGNPLDRASHTARNGNAGGLFSRAHNFSSTPSYSENWGLVTEFLPAVVVPEPSTYALLGTGMVALLIARHRRKHD
jgi:hypothetical protein